MLKDFVLETCSAPGTTTTVNLAGAATGRMSFAQAFTSGAAAYYYMDDGTQAEWGYGIFTSGSPNTITRATVLGNTAGTTARLNFAGSTRIYNWLPSARTPWIDGSGNLTAPGTVFFSGSTTFGAVVSSGSPTLNFAASNFIQYVPATGITASTTGLLSLVAASGIAVSFTTANALVITQTGTTAATAIIADVHVTSSPLTIWRYQGTAIGSITTNGSTTAYNTSSDYRLKITYGPADGTPLSALPIYSASWKADATAARQPMVLAHELAAVAPWAVRGDKDAVDEAGNPVMQQVDHSALVPLLIAYAQSLEKRIAALEAKP